MSTKRKGANGKGIKDWHVLLVTVAIIALDQLTKFLVKKYMILGQSIPIIKGVFHLTYVLNTGAGFSILRGHTSLLIWISLIITGVLLYYYNSFEPRHRLFIGLIIAGSIGNLIDRILLGHVVDFLNFQVWPIFNVADSSISIAVAGLVILLIKKR